MNVLRKEFDRYDLRKNTKSPVCYQSICEKTGRVVKTLNSNNLVLYSGADILSLLLAGHSEFKIGAMYMEFMNLADPDDPITPPAFDRSGGSEYYASLATSPNVDYLRVPIVLNPLNSASGPNYVANRATFFAISEGVVGVNGKEFSAAANSAVYGAALVSTPDFGDQSKDVIYSRDYSEIGKVLKQTGFQIGITWVQQFN